MIDTIRPSGKHLVIEVNEYGQAIATVDGRKVHAGAPGALSLPVPNGGITADGITYTRCLGPVLLLSDEADLVDDAIRAMKKRPSLTEQRDRLVDAIVDARDQQQRAWATADERTGWSAVREAERALADFDSAHPELTARREARRQAEQRENANRNMWM